MDGLDLSGLQLPPEDEPITTPEASPTEPDFSGLEIPELPEVQPEVKPEVTDDLNPVVDGVVSAADGVRDGVQGTLDTAKVVDDALNLGGITFGDAADNGIVGFESPDEWAAKKANGVDRLELPDIQKKASGLTGEITHDISQFLTGMLGADKALKTVGWAGNTVKSRVGREIVAGGLSEAVAMNPREEGLSDLLNNYPVFEQIIPDFLTAHPDDSEMEARLRKFVDGLAWGTLGESLFLGFKSFRASRAGKTEEADTLIKEAEDVAQGKVDPYQAEREALEKSIDDKAVKTKANNAELEKIGIDTKPETKVIFGAKSMEAFETSLTNAKTQHEINEVIEGTDFNFDNLTSEDDIKHAINSMSDTISKQMKRFTGGVQDDTSVKTYADAMGMDESAAIQILSEVSGSADNLAAKATMGRVLVQKFGDRVADLAELVANPKTATDEVKAKLFEETKIFAEVVAMQKGLQTNIARALASHRIKVGTKVDGIDTDLWRKIIDESGGDANLIKFAEGFSLNRGSARHMTETLEQSFQQKGKLAKFVDVHNDFWINGILTGMYTHSVNISSNLIQAVMIPSQRMIGAAVEMDGKGIREGAAHFMAMYKSAGESIRAAKHSWNIEDTVLDVAVDTQGSKIEVPKTISSRMFGKTPDSGAGKAIDRTGKAVRFFGSRLLGAEDEFFKQITYRSRVRSKSYGEGLEKGLNGSDLEDFVENSLKESFDKNGRGIDHDALQLSREATFTQELEYGAGKWIQDGLNKAPVARLLIPFIKTPTNLIRTAWQHTPLLRRTQRQLQADLEAGGVRAQIAKGKIHTGNAIAISAIGLGMTGNMTGGVPKDRAERSALMATGWKPYSFVTMDDEGTKAYHPYGRLDPYGMIFGVIADAISIQDKVGEDEWSDIALATMTAVTNNLSSKSYLANVSKTFDIIASGNPNKLERWMQYQASSYIPNVINQGNVADPHMREARTFVEAAMKRLPIASEEVSPLRTVLGEPVARQQHSIPLVHQSEHKDEPVYEELAKLGGAVRKPPEKIGNVDLTRFKNEKGQDAYDRYLELHSTYKDGDQTLKDALLEAINEMNEENIPYSTDEYTSLRHKEIQTILGDFRSEIKEQLLEEGFTFEGEGLLESIELDEAKREAAGDGEEILENFSL